MSWDGTSHHDGLMPGHNIGWKRPVAIWRGQSKPKVPELFCAEAYDPSQAIHEALTGFHTSKRRKYLLDCARAACAKSGHDFDALLQRWHDAKEASTENVANLTQGEDE